jgi:hypothetical protein
MKRTIAAVAFLTGLAGTAMSGQSLAEIAAKTPVAIGKVWTNGDLTRRPDDKVGKVTAIAPLSVETVRAPSAPKVVPPAVPSRTAAVVPPVATAPAEDRNSFLNDHVMKGGRFDQINQVGAAEREWQRLKAIVDADPSKAAQVYGVGPICINGECYPKR